MTTLHIKTITTDYDANEDRLCLSIADVDGQSAVLWLTRRLADRLIVALLPWLTQTEVAEAPVAVQQAVQTYAQLQARLMQKPAVPVLRDAAAWEALVREMSLGSNSQGQRYLTFKCAGTSTEVVLPLSRRQLRQWLQVIHRHYQIADWQSTVWPTWMYRASPLTPN